jgi:hypothetical protein
VVLEAILVRGNLFQRFLLAQRSQKAA